MWAIFLFSISTFEWVPNLHNCVFINMQVKSYEAFHYKSKFLPNSAKSFLSLDISKILSDPKMNSKILTPYFQLGNNKQISILSSRHWLYCYSSRDTWMYHLLLLSGHKRYKMPHPVGLRALLIVHTYQEGGPCLDGMSAWAVPFRALHHFRIF